MPKVAASSFETLRTWNGEQSRAFEELSFQLLKDKVPSGTRAIRTCNPGGGVEWYVALSDGTEWGWQAKHVHGIEAHLTAMTNSVHRVAKERPSLRKLTFVISWNLATNNAGKGGRERKSQRQKYEDKIKTWLQVISGANKIEFDLSTSRVFTSGRPSPSIQDKPTTETISIARAPAVRLAAATTSLLAFPCVPPTVTDPSRTRRLRLGSVRRRADHLAHCRDIAHHARHGEGDHERRTHQVLALLLKILLTR